METIPELRDWKTFLEGKLKTAGHDKKDLLNIIHECDDIIRQIQPINLWLGRQQGFVTQISRLFGEMYFTRFGEQPPPRSTETPITEVILDTTERRKQVIKEVALSLVKLGEDVSDEAVFEELKHRNMKLDTSNPNAIISTILRGFKPQFEKVQGKRGVFKRKQ